MEHTMSRTWIRAVAVSFIALAVLSSTDALAAKSNDKGNAFGIIKGGLFGSGGSQCVSTAAPPTINGWPTFSLIEGEAYAFAPTASDPNCDTLTFSIAGKPSWASFSTRNGALTGTPPSGTAGTYSGIVISVSDGTYTTSLASFSITVYANHPPVLTGTPPGKAIGGQLYSFTPGVFDGDGQMLRFSAGNVPSWAGFDATTGKLEGTPTDAQAGTFTGISISVSDGLLSDSIGPFDVTVEPGNRAPSISGQPAPSVMAGQSYVFTPTATDADGDTLTFAVSNKPTWASFDAASGRLSGTPPESAAGEYIGIGISVSDGKASASLAAFSIVVDVANRAPTISGTPATSVTARRAPRWRRSASLWTLPTARRRSPARRRRRSRPGSPTGSYPGRRTWTGMR